LGGKEGGGEGEGQSVGGFAILTYEKVSREKGKKRKFRKKGGGGRGLVRVGT